MNTVKQIRDKQACKESVRRDHNVAHHPQVRHCLPR